jgi:hypothetical protein
MGCTENFGPDQPVVHPKFNHFFEKSCNNINLFIKASFTAFLFELKLHIQVGSGAEWVEVRSVDENLGVSNRNRSFWAHSFWKLKCSAFSPILRVSVSLLAHLEVSTILNSE